MRYFPSDPNARGALMEFLVLICPHKESLEWLVSELVNKIGEWPGAAELRGLLSTRYMPADGMRTDCGIPGYRPEDYERQELDRHETRKVGGLIEDDPMRSLVSGLAEIKRLT